MEPGPRPGSHPCGSGYPQLVTELRSTGDDTSADDEGATGGPTIAPTPYTLGEVPGPLDADELRRLDAWWRAANYLAVGQIYLVDNALLREPMRPEHVKPRLLGHFGTVPGLNLTYAHASRAIVARDTRRGVRRRSRPRRSRSQRVPRGSRERRPSSTTT